MKYAILQMPVSIWHANNVIFDPGSKVSHSDYCYVYKDDIPEQYADPSRNHELLEYLFEMYNIRHPQNYAGRSMSAGDVVMIERDNERKYYLCCSFGWSELESF